MDIEVIVEQNDIIVELVEDVVIATYADGIMGPTGLTGPAGAGVPVGGAPGHVLVKAGSGDYDTGWAPQKSVPVGGIAGQVLTKLSDTDFDVAWGVGISTLYVFRSGSLTQLTSRLHSDLQSKDADDHPQYILANGTRSFTEKVKGVDPTEPLHFSTKGYVDSYIQGLNWQEAVKDQHLGTPPPLPTEGDRYIVPSGATGAWSTHAKDVAEWNTGAWVYFTPVEGWACWISDEDVLMTFNGTTWVQFGSTTNHDALSGVTANQHHNQTHELNGSDHLTTGGTLDWSKINHIIERVTGTPNYLKPTTAADNFAIDKILFDVSNRDVSISRNSTKALTFDSGSGLVADTVHTFTGVFSGSGLYTWLEIVGGAGSGLIIKNAGGYKTRIGKISGFAANYLVFSEADNASAQDTYLLFGGVHLHRSSGGFEVGGDIVCDGTLIIRAPLAEKQGGYGNSIKFELSHGIASAREQVVSIDGTYTGGSPIYATPVDFSVAPAQTTYPTYLGKSAYPFSKLFVAGAGGTNAQGIQLGADVTLFRSTTDLLKTEDSFECAGQGKYFLINDYVSALPAASSTYRGQIVRKVGAAGVKDILYCCMKSAADSYSWVEVAPASGVSGTGKMVLWLTPGTAILPNTLFGRLEKVTRTNGVDYVINFLADGVADANDEGAYWTIPVPAFYAGGAITITVYSLANLTNAALVSKFYIEGRGVAHDGIWDAAHTAIGNCDINPTAAARDLLVDTIAWSAGLPTAGHMFSFKVYVDHSASTYGVGKDCEILAIKIEEN